MTTITVQPPPERRVIDSLRELLDELRRERRERRESLTTLRRIAEALEANPAVQRAVRRPAYGTLGDRIMGEMRSLGRPVTAWEVAESLWRDATITQHYATTEHLARSVRATLQSWLASGRARRLAPGLYTLAGVSE